MGKTIKEGTKKDLKLLRILVILRGFSPMFWKMLRFINQ